MSLTLVLDVIIVVLLVATIVFAAILNSRLNDLRRNKDQLGRLINSFNDATTRAESGIPRLRKTAEEAGQALHEQVEKAQTLRDDLAFLIDRADTTASRLEGTVRSARTDVKPAAQPAASAGRGAAVAARRPFGGLDKGPSLSTVIGEGDMVDDDERSEAERELLRALQSAR